MRIKRIEIFGFKSFVEPATIELEKGICCIVGPNGCGKSNIVDAVKWALGEQSLKSLRARTSGDLIFSGTETRKPLGYAEVTLVFDNSQKLAPPPFSELSEIAITRRIYRDGDSEFFINRRPARLKHIQDLFVNVSPSKGAYSVVEQGEIERVIEAKPEERRKMLEQAAGVAKFRIQKEESLRKIEQTKQDLARINDILAEQERQLRSLKRQAKKAERYHQYKSELREIDLSLAAHEYRSALKSLSSLKRELASATAMAEGLKAQKDKCQMEIQALKLKLPSIENSLEQTRSRKSELESELARLSERRRQLAERESELMSGLDGIRRERERIRNELEETEVKQAQYSDALSRSKDELERLNKENSRLQTEIEALKSRRADVNSKLDDCRARKLSVEREIALVASEIERIQEQMERAKNLSERIGAELEKNRSKQDELQRSIEGVVRESDEVISRRREIARELEEVKQKLKKRRVEAESKKEAFERIKEKLNRRETELAALKEMERNLEGYQKGVRAILERARTRGESSIRGVLADFIEAEPEYEVAVGVVLGERLQSVLVDKPKTGISAIEYLKQTREGRSSFIPLELKLFSTGEQSSGPPTGDYELVPLFEKVKAAPEVSKLVEMLLSNVYVVDDLKRAQQIMESDGFPPEFKLVTPDGEVWEKRGVISGGTAETPSSGLLKNKRTIKQYETEIAWLKVEEERTRNELLRTQGFIDRLESKLAALEAEINESEKRAIELAMEKEKLELMLKNLKEREASMVQNMESPPLVPTEKLEPLGARKEELSRQLVEIEKQIGSLESHLDAVETELNSKLTEYSKNEARIHGIENEIASIEGKLFELETHRENLGSRSAATSEREEDLNRRLADIRRELDECTALAEDRRGELDRIEKELADLLESYRRIASEIDYIEGEHNSIAKQLEETGERIGSLKVEQERLNVSKEHIVREMKEKYNEDLERKFHAYPEIDDPDPLRARRAELLEKIERMGEVNPLADREYKEIYERYEFLQKQKEDLESSIENLRRAIKRINQTSRELLQKTLEAVNERFQQIVPLLFKGGRGQLRLSLPEGSHDILEAGLEINVQPQGKKLKSMDLLSGGEKAMAALCFISALFLTKPAPFCILDEVDAPLDEANIDRFRELIKLLSENSQIMLISHNRRTMEMVDVLYGVTMEEPGVSKLVSIELSDVS